MEYKEIIKLTDLTQREEELKKYYLEEVKALDWLYDENLEQKIVFNDRVEYKYNNQYHNYKDGAIIYNNGDKFYYIFGEKTEPDVWLKLAKKYNISQKIKREMEIK